MRLYSHADRSRWRCAVVHPRRRPSNEPFSCAHAAKADWGAVDEVIFGCANQAGEDNRNVARMSALLARFPVEVPDTTVNRLCGPGMDAIAIAARRHVRRSFVYNSRWSRIYVAGPFRGAKDRKHVFTHCRIPRYNDWVVLGQSRDENVFRCRFHAQDCRKRGRRLRHHASSPRHIRASVTGQGGPCHPIRSLARKIIDVSAPQRRSDTIMELPANTRVRRPKRRLASCVLCFGKTEQLLPEMHPGSMMVLRPSSWQTRMRPSILHCHQLRGYLARQRPVCHRGLWRLVRSLPQRNSCGVLACPRPFSTWSR